MTESADTAAPSLDGLLQRPIDHICYSVPDIETAVGEWTRLGVGPFLVMHDVEFDEVTSHGEPAVFLHSAAFTKWGETYLELNQIKDARPSEVRHGLQPHSGAAVSHVGYDVEDPDRTSAQIEALGFPLYLYARKGPIEAWYHQIPALGHTIELHRAGDVMTGFWQMLSDATDAWDGSDPLRVVSPD